MAAAPARDTDRGGPVRCGGRTDVSVGYHRFSRWTRLGEWIRRIFERMLGFVARCALTFKQRARGDKASLFWRNARSKCIVGAGSCVFGDTLGNLFRVRFEWRDWEDAPLSRAFPVHYSAISSAALSSAGELG